MAGYSIAAVAARFVKNFKAEAATETAVVLSAVFDIGFAYLMHVVFGWDFWHVLTAVLLFSVARLNEARRSSVRK